MGFTRALVCAIAVGVWGIAQAASIGSSQSPADATLERAALYLDNSSVRLDELVSAIHTEAGDSEVDEALFQYMREFSQFHVTIGQLRIGKRETSFATRAVKELRSQLSRLEAISNDLPPSAALAYNEALGHLRSALEMVIQKLDSKSRKHLLTMGAVGPVMPSAASR